jgi:hypothetical protein
VRPNEPSQPPDPEVANLPPRKNKDIPRLKIGQVKSAKGNPFSLSFNLEFGLRPSGTSQKAYRFESFTIGVA